MPRGQVLQAATSCDRNNALLVTAEPNPVAVGQKIKITSQVKPECQSGLSGSSSYLYQIYNRGASNPFQSDLRQGLTAVMEFNATTAQFSPGGHTIDTVLSYEYDSNSGSWLYEFKGSAQVTSVVAQGGGAAQLSVVPSNGVDVGLTTSTKSFDVSFTPGSDGKSAAQISYKCSATAPELKVAVTGGSAKVSCEYPKQAATHAVTIQALDSTGTLIPGAQWSGNATLTGNEVNQTGTNSTGNPLILFFNLIIGGVLKLFIEAMGWGAAAIGTMLEAVLTIRTFSDEFAQVIYPAWEIFRNLGNIVFILAIVAIGVATVFRISQYQVKDLLVKLILGAILINFSLTIAQAVLGISDTLQQQFLSDGSGALRSIINALFVSNIWSNAPNVQLGDFSETIRILSQFFIAFAAFFALLGVAILVCVRVVMLWLLLMLSPIPYVAMVLPATRKFSSQWWDKFINWALVTPAVGFMLNLTALMTTKNRDVIEKLTASSQIALNESWLNSVAFSLASNVIPLIFLYMTLQVATSFGKGAGGFVTKSLNKVSGMAFAPAAAMGGFAAGAASGVGKFAQNVAKAPVVLTQQKLAESKNARDERYRTGKATAMDRVMSTVAAPVTAGKLLDAKIKRIEGDLKSEKDEYSTRIADLERRKYNWKGTKALGNKVLLSADKNIVARFSDYRQNKRLDVKTDAELDALLASVGMSRKGDGGIDETAIKQEVQRVRDRLKEEGLSDDERKKLEAEEVAYQTVLKDREARRSYKSAIQKDYTEDNIDAFTEEDLANFRSEAQKNLDTTAARIKSLEARSKIAPSLLEDKFRRSSTKSASARMPDEYVYGEYAAAFDQAVAKGDKYAALLAWQTIEQEGDIKDLLKKLQYADNATGLKEFVKDYFGGGKGAFNLGDETVTQLLRESDKRVKSAGHWDLAGKIKFDDKTGTYVEQGEGARIGKNLEGKIGEGTVGSLWGSLTGKVSFTTQDGEAELSQTFLEGLRKLPLDNPETLQQFMNRLNTSTAKSITAIGSTLKTEEDVQRVKDQLQKFFAEDLKRPEKFDDVYKLIQYAGGVVPVSDKQSAEDAKKMREEVMKVVRKVNEDVSELRGKGRKGGKKQASSYQGGTGGMSI